METAEALPERGEIAFVRQRRYLVENVTAAPATGQATLVELSCLDDDAQGEQLAVLWEHELDARVVKDSGWGAVAEKGFDDPPLFAAYLRTLSWNCVTATDPEIVPGAVSRRHPNRDLPARAAEQGAAAAAGQPVHRRRRRSRQDHRGRADCARAAASPTHRQDRRGLPALDARPMARRDGVAVRARVHHPRPSARDAHAQRARILGQSLDDALALPRLAPPAHRRGVRLGAPGLAGGLRAAVAAHPR